MRKEPILTKDHLRRLAQRPSSPYILVLVLVILAIVGGIALSRNLVPTVDAEIAVANKNVPAVQRL